MPDPDAPPHPVDARLDALADTLDVLLDRVEALTRATDTLTPLLERAPAALAILADSADEAYDRAAASGVDLDARVHALLRVVEKLSAPRTIAVLTALLDRIELIERLIQAADQAPGLVAMLVDSADETAARAQAAGIDFERGVGRGLGAALRLGSRIGPAQLDALEAMLDAGVLDPPSVRLVGGLGRAMVSSAGSEPPRLGPVGLLRAMRDPDAQRALGFFSVVAKEVGRQLDRAATPAAASPIHSQ